MLFMSDLLLSADTFTHLSSAHDTTSWIDHIVTSKSVAVISVNVWLDWAIFYHFPIGVNLPVMYEPLAPSERKECPDHVKVQWAQFKEPAVRKNYNDFIIR